MKCDFYDAGPSQKCNNCRLYRCRRNGCNLTADTFLPPERVHAICQAWPGPFDPEWLAIFTAVYADLARPMLDAWRARGSNLAELPAEIPRPPQPPLNRGPGTELKRIFAALDITPKSACQCNQLAADMDRTFADGTFEEHRPRYLAALKESYDEASVLTKLKAGALALAHGLPLTLDGMVSEAVRRASIDSAAPAR